MHVNTGNCVEEKNVNCALCTAAALTGQSSGDVNADLQLACASGDRWGPFKSDDAFIRYAKSVPAVKSRRRIMANKAAQPLADQMIGIAYYVVQKTAIGGFGVKFCGDPQNGTRGAVVLPFMNRQPAGTQFAVFTSDGNSVYGDDAHWIYAKKTGNDQLQFMDFQTDTQVPSATPKVSQYPLGPGGTEYTNANNTYMIALAFGANLAD